MFVKPCREKVPPSPQTPQPTEYLRADYRKYIPSGQTVYEYMEEGAKKFGNRTALSFYGMKTTYRRLFEKVNEAERALRGMGVGNGDIVAVSLPGIPEAVHLIYAINKIGAVYCAFDCRSKEKEIFETLEKFKPKLCIVPCFQIKDFRHVDSCKVISVEMTHSLGGFAKIGAFFAHIFTGRVFVQCARKNIMSYNSFLKNAAGGENLPAEKNRDNVFGFFYTSGTTYGRKSIILTNENINAAARQMDTVENWRERGNTVLNIMPMFTCYGVTVATHFPLSSGFEVRLIPLINTKKMKNTLLREKPNFLISVPAHWEYFVKDRFRGCDLSFLKTVIVGGDKMAPEYHTRINGIFEKCRSSARLRCGYGLSESTSTGTFPGEDAPSESVGKPGKYTLVGVFDKDTYAPLPVGTPGEICIFGPTVCKGYYGDREMTDMLLKQHSDGTLWLHSGDTGYLDEHGNLFFCERMKRMYVRYDGTKISPYAIEQILEKCPQIERCMIVAIPDKSHACGMCGRALIVLRKNTKAARGEAEKYIRKNLGIHMVPKEISYVDALPYTKNGKLDYFSTLQETP